jgi:hypothetical protein
MQDHHRRGKQCQSCAKAEMKLLNENGERPVQGQ